MEKKTTKKSATPEQQFERFVSYGTFCVHGEKQSVESHMKSLKDAAHNLLTTHTNQPAHSSFSMRHADTREGDSEYIGDLLGITLDALHEAVYKLESLPKGVDKKKISVPFRDNPERLWESVVEVVFLVQRMTHIVLEEKNESKKRKKR